MRPFLFDPVLSSRLKKSDISPEIRASRRGIAGPIHCYHCQKKITGMVYWLRLKPFCHYCYGFRSVLLAGMREEMDDKMRKALREKVLEEQNKMDKNE